MSVCLSDRQSVDETGIEKKKNIFTVFAVMILGPHDLRLAVRPNEMSYRNYIGLILQFFSKAFVSCFLLTRLNMRKNMFD